MIVNRNLILKGVLLIPLIALSVFFWVKQTSTQNHPTVLAPTGRASPAGQASLAMDDVLEKGLEKADVNMTHFSFIQTDSGHTKWAWVAEQVHWWEKEQKATLKKVTVTFYETKVTH